MLTSGATSSNSSSNSSQQGNLFQQMKEYFAGNKESSPQNKDALWDDEPNANPDPAPPAKTLSDFDSLFTPAPVDPNAPKDAPAVDPFSHLTKDTLAKAAANLDFSQAVPEELVNKALSGDPAALRQTINGAVQAAFVEMMSGSNTIADKRIQFALQNQAKQMMQQQLRDHAMDAEISTNPILSNPATKPIRDALTTAIRSANPSITPKELNSKLTDYLQTFANEVNGGNPNQSNNPIPGNKQRVNPQKDAWDF